ncbi:hypothetical protein FRC01_014354 [Tulasnella sp. 417]|nr:hypothetical protein FRC01_014354 [Tulasnella sp. 417]
MATQAFRIVSEYDPPKDDATPDVISLPDDGWSTGHTFCLSKRILHPPKFVRPSGDYDEYGRPKETEEDDEIQIIEHRPSNLGQWYGSLSRSSLATAGAVTSPPPRPASAPATEPTPSRNQAQHSSANLPPFLKNLSRRLEADDSTSIPRASSSSSLPDMLARAPPPLPSEAPFIPPTFTVLGPANKGYSILERHGWREGQTLGPGNYGHGNRAGIGFVAKQEDPECEEPKRANLKGRDVSDASAVDVVDLTLEDGSESDEERPTSADPNAQPVQNSSGGRALLTPLPTVLRADNAGIGSNRGTKRVITQSAHALELAERRKKRNRKSDSIVRVGAKALINKAKKEQQERSALLAYMREE